MEVMDELGESDGSGRRGNGGTPSGARAPPNPFLITDSFIPRRRSSWLTNDRPANSPKGASGRQSRHYSKSSRSSHCSLDSSARSTLAHRQRLQSLHNQPPIDRIELQCAVAFSSYTDCPRCTSDTESILGLLDHAGYLGASLADVERVTDALMAEGLGGKAPAAAMPRPVAVVSSGGAAGSESPASELMASIDSKSGGGGQGCDFTFATFTALVERLYETLGGRFRNQRLSSSHSNTELMTAAELLPDDLRQMLLAPRSPRVATPVEASPERKPQICDDAGGVVDISELRKMAGQTDRNAEALFVDLGGKPALLPGDPPSGTISLESVQEFLKQKDMPKDAVAPLGVVARALCGAAGMHFEDFRVCVFRVVMTLRKGARHVAMLEAMAKVAQRLGDEALNLTAHERGVAVLLKCRGLPANEQKERISSFLLSAIQKDATPVGMPSFDANAPHPPPPPRHTDGRGAGLFIR